MATRQFRSFTRKTEFRDAKFIVIATEGSKTEPRYFEALAIDDRYRNPRVHVEVLSRVEDDAGSSAPNHILDQLTRYEKDNDLVEGDELWIVIDKDKWEDSMLGEITRLVKQKQYRFADSNPCFELWLLLHYRSLDSYTDSELADLKANNKERFRSTRRRLDLELKEICGSYDSNNLKTSDYLPYVHTAIDNARNADSNLDDRWLNQIGSRVYKLVQSIIDSSAQHPLN